MREIRQAFVEFFTSLKLTVVLLVLSIVLVFWATLAQVKLGIWGVQQEFFRTFFVLVKYPGTDVPIPVFPGGYLIGGFLLVNLIASHLFHFRLTWKKVGIQLTHFGLILLLVGELLSGLLQEDFQMRLDEGQTKNYSEALRATELVIVDVTDPEWDQVVAIPAPLLIREGDLQHPKLPFRVSVRAYLANAGLQNRDPATPAPASTLPVKANRGIGESLVVTPMPITYRENERNLPAAYLELVGPDGSLGTWFVSSHPALPPQPVEVGGRKFQLQMRFEREYKPFALTLLDFSHDRYAGTDTPKNFSSRVRLKSDDGQEDREVLIYMNNPLRYGGLTFYQASFDNEDRTTILQVVRNPSWQIPYIACLVMFVGLTLQFGLHLYHFAQRRSKPATA